MTAKRLLTDCRVQRETVEQLLKTLEDEKLVETAAQYGMSEEWHVLQRYRAIDEYRKLLKGRLQALTEGR